MPKSQNAAAADADAPIAVTPDQPGKTSKLDQLVALLSSADGAAMSQMMAATQWQAHSIRGAMAGALRRKGFAVTSAKTETGRRWRIMPEAGQ